MRYNAAMAYDQARQQMVMFGGCCAADAWDLADTWIRGAAGWRQVIPATSPPAREIASMAYDAARGQAVLFGGASIRTSDGARDLEVFGDTWVWDGQTWTEMQPPTSPSPRVFASMTYDAERQEVVLFGGADFDDDASDDNETWVWDGSNWTKRNPSNSPSPRIDAKLSYDQRGKNVVLFGGSEVSACPVPIPPLPRVPSTCGGAQNDTWTWDGENWVEHDPPIAPPARGQAVMAYDVQREQTVLFGGSTSSSATWLWDGSTWREVQSEHAPSQGFTLRSPTMSYDSQSNEMVLFGGLHDGVYFMDQTWTWDGTQWEQVPRTWPGSRSPLATYDAARDELALVHVGTPCTRETCTIETWTWDGSTWTHEGPSASPPPRDGGSIAYDAERQEVVLFGGGWGIECPQAGRCRLRMRNDTWTWDGQDWTLREPSLSPPARRDATMTYDTERREVIMFGGEGDCQPGQSDCTKFNDTWAWDGQSWTQREPAVSPSARRRASMVYDRNTGRIVLFGGESDEGTRGDTWTWDGVNWTEQQPETAPPAREWPAMGYSDSAGKVILFGGAELARSCGSESIYCNDTWTWDGTSWSELMPGSGTSAPSYSGQASERSLSAVAEGPEGKFVVFGGQGLGQNDMWTTPVVALPSESESPSSSESPLESPSASESPSVSPSQSPSVSPSPSTSQSPSESESPGPDDVTTRISGTGRIETAIEISQAGFDDGKAGAVVLARSNLFPDALAGTPLAIAGDAPLLLTETEALNPLSEAEIQRVLPAGGTVFVLGGVQAVSQAVEDRIVELGFQVTRYGGPNRFATAVVIADQGLGNPAILLAATGNDFADALAAGAVGGVEDIAIVLTAAETLPPETSAYLDSRPQTTRYGVGGPASAAVPGSIPLAGATRFETAVLVAEEFIDAPEVVGVARAREFADALAGGADVGRDGGPILLSETDTLADSVRAYLEANADSINEARIYGGVQAISEAVASDVDTAIQD